MPRVFKVHELTNSIREMVEMHFPFVWVQGQVSNLSRPGSGHVYFTLKDEQAGLQAVWFKNVQGISRRPNQKNPADSLQNGQNVVCAGRIGVYPPRGTYQLIVELLQEQGPGELFLCFEALKARLKEQGFFDPGRKKAIPCNPDSVGVITAVNGAALQDFLRVSEEMGLGARIIVYPSLVQGETAPAELARAIACACAHDLAQVLVIMRGGGSLEDLWAFNSEEVARAVFNSHIPIITGIGHEVDTTIADLTADFRAATPSHVPQHLWGHRKDLFIRVDEQEIYLLQAYQRFLQARKDYLVHTNKALSWLSPGRQLQRREDLIASLERSLRRESRDFLDRYSRSVDEMEERIKIRLGPDYWDIREQYVEYLQEQILSRARSFWEDRLNRFYSMQEKLKALDPYAPIRRGYSLVTIEHSRKYLRSVSDVSSGDDVSITVLDGKVDARVRGQRTEDRGQRTENREQRTEDHAKSVAGSDRGQGTTPSAWQADDR